MFETAQHTDFKHTVIEISVIHCSRTTRVIPPHCVLCLK